MPLTEFLRRQGLTLVLIVIVVVGLLLQRERQPVVDGSIHELTGRTMGTTYSVKLVDMPQQMPAQQLAETIGAALTRLDRELMSTYSADSELSRLNRAPINTVLPLSAEMTEVLALAQQLSERTGGAFDVTVGPLVNRWGFGPQAVDDAPGQPEIDALLASVGYQKLQLDVQAATLTKTGEVYIDLSGIAKGYAVDQVAGLLDSLDVASYFIEVGGELRIKGYKPGNESWVPAIEKPVDDAPEVHEIFYARGEAIAVAGSGDYRNYFELGGVRYSHEIDPATGRPVRHNLAAVYVIAPSAAAADAWATAFMVLGADKGYVLAEREQLAVYFITRSSSGEGFDERYTAGFEHYLSPAR